MAENKSYNSIKHQQRQLKKKEYFHQRWANMTIEERKKKTEDARMRRANMTEEEHQRMLEYKRRYRANMSEEERLKSSEYFRNYRANKTEEEKNKYKEYQRIRNASLTQEARLIKAEKARIRRANMTDEERKKYLEYERVRRPNKERRNDMSKIKQYKRKLCSNNLTENKFIKKSEYNQNQYANMTEEERIACSEYKRKQKNTMTEEQRTRYLEEKCIKMANKAAEGVQLSMKIRINPMKKLFKQMFDSRMNVEIISRLPKNMFKEILKLIGISSPSKNVTLNYIYAIQHLSYKINLRYLVELLKRWEGWTIYNCFDYFDSDENYDALLSHLKCKFLEFNLCRDLYIQEELNNSLDFENYISTKCTLNQLKNLFYRDPQNYPTFYREDKFDTDSWCQSKPSSSQSIITWPYVSTKIILPHFTLTHQNIHTDVYALTNATNGSNETLAECQKTKLYGKKIFYKTICKMYPKNNVEQLLRELKNAVIDKACDDMTSSDRKAEIVTALTIFKKSFTYCPDVIKSNTNYNRKLSPYPYVRYLRYPDDGDNYASSPDRNNFNYDIRLRQIRQPKISYFLECLDGSCDDINESNNAVNEWVLHKMNTCISYRCLLCNESLGSCSASQIVSEHFMKYHGREPDWECTKCAVSFTNNDLSNNDWTHDCK